ncbi:MAG: tyrosine-type recombinase/integrase [Bacteroidetes bacterium]|nr:tyrosine-type recombinase/integrase [Bacteroidota bacterium]
MDISGFLNYITHHKRYSSHTITAYHNDIEQFYIYLQAQFETTSIADVNYHYIRSWIVSLMDNEISARTINRKITTLRTYYKYLIKQGELSENPMKKIQAPKMAKKLPVFIEKSKMQLLLDEPKEEGEGIYDQRDQIIMELFYNCGIRLAELVGLKLGDVNLNKQQLKVLGKRNKERVVPVTAGFCAKASEYFDWRSQQPIETSEFFIAKNGLPINRKYVYRLVKRKLAPHSTREKKSPHVLRHTFATHMLDNGADINAIKEILGHASLAATQVYTHNTIEKLKNIHLLAHPRGGG